MWSEVPYNFDGTDSPAFDRNLKRQLREMIRQNYNHPSIVFWGMANALDSTPHTNRLVRQLDDIVQIEDPSRFTVLGTPNRVPAGAAINFATGALAMNSYYGWYHEDFDGFGKWADAFHERYPDRALGVAEAGAGASAFQHEAEPSNIDDLSDWHPEEYQNLFHEAQWRQMVDRPYLWGKAIFAMFDFAVDDRDEGDTPGRNDKGLVTYDRRTRKDAFYFYKSNWSDEPTVHVTSGRWTVRESRDVPELKVYSNLDRVEVRVNGRSLGVRDGDRVNVFRWADVRLDAGRNVVEAIGSRDGRTFTDTVVWVTDASDGGLRGTYFSDVQLQSAAFTRVDRTVDFNWGTGSPSDLLSADRFGVRWEGTVLSGRTGTYTFYAGGNDGVRLYVDGRLLIDQFAVGSAAAEHVGTILLEGGRWYDITLDYFENTGGASARLSWSGPGQAKQVVPAGRLLPA